MSKFFSKKFSSLSPYVPGEQPKMRKFIKLNTNESPFTPSKSAKKLAKEAIKNLQLYSDPECKMLVKEYAKQYNQSEDKILFSNGSDEILNFAFMAYCDKDTPAIFPDITYGFYPVFATLNGVEYKEIPLKEDFSIDITDYYNANGTIFIANPNAPTGMSLELVDIEQILIHNPSNMVIIDEAYVDFGGESAVKLTDKYDNLLVVQTFSKSRSMAGARLGSGVANKSVIEDLNTIKYSTNPYNVNATTQALGIGALKDRKYFTTNCNKIISNREYVEKELKELGFSLTKSKANFVFVCHDKIGGKELTEKLREKGILVRWFNKPKIKNYLRITIGNINEMKALIKAVKEILEEI